MMPFEQILSTIGLNPMLEWVEKWANINSGSENLEGLHQMAKALKEAFSPLHAKMEEISLPSFMKKSLEKEDILVPLGKALAFSKRPQAPVQIFLGGHMDTVYPVDSPFQKCLRLDNKRLQGPGVIDMKGGLAIMLQALMVLESSPYAEQVGWKAFINPDEEIGSPGTESYFLEAAPSYHVGLLFEPCWPDGDVVSERKGSANYSVIAKGKSSHVGRDFSSGRNAIVALACLAKALHELNSTDGAILNVGYLQGGGILNVVPDKAILGFNMRFNSTPLQEKLEKQITSHIEEIEKKMHVTLKLHRPISKGSKPFDAKTQALFEKFKECGQELGLSLRWRPSGGTCDGNILAEGGLPTIDTLGAQGQGMHTHEECLLVDSLVERARLVALFLLKVASGEIILKG